MPTLKFTVLPTGVAQLHDLLSCLAKFDENISLEASNDDVSYQSQWADSNTDLLVSHLKPQYIQNGICIIQLRRKFFLFEIYFPP